MDVETRRFAPPEMSGALISQELLERQAALEGLLQHMDITFGDEFAHDFLAELRSRPLRLLLNADNPLVKRLARVENLYDPSYCLLLVGLYNSAIIYSQQMTVENARIIYAQFQQHMLKALELEEEVRVLRRERLQQPGLGGPVEPRGPGGLRTWTKLFVMISYDRRYVAVESALRTVLQSAPYFFEVALAKDLIHRPETRLNIQAHIRGSDGFIADISDHSPNVYLELGWPRFAPEFQSHPQILLRARDSAYERPEDLADLIYIEYDSPESPSLPEVLREELARHRALEGLLEKRRERYLGPDLLGEWAPCRGNKEARERISKEYCTFEAVLRETPEGFRRRFSGRDDRWIGNLLEDLKEYLDKLGTPGPATPATP